MKLRLLFVITSSDFGGSESFLLRLITGLDRDVIDIEVCSLCPPGRIAGEIQALGIPVTSLHMDTRAKPFQMAVAVLRLAKLFRSSFGGRGAHGMQSLLYRANVLAALACRFSWLRLRRPPFLVTGQRSLIPTGRSLDFKAQRLTRNWADRVVAVSDAVKLELHQTETIADEKVIVIQNGIELSRFTLPSDGERDAARREWNLEDEALVIGAVGRFHGPKGLNVLIDALHRARRLNTKLTLVLAGDGPDAKALETQVESLELTRWVRFLGFQKDPRPLYPGFDLYVLPSLKEGSPNALLEAMGRGCACIASEVGGVPEAIIDGESGYLIPPSDPEALAAVILELADDADRRAELAKAARARVESHFELSKMIQAHQALYLGLRNA